MINRFFLLLFSSFAITLSSQTVKETLVLTQTTLAGDSLLLTGFKPETKNLKFVVILYDKLLKELNRYEKTIEPGAKSYFVERINNTFRFTFFSATNSVKYRISTDLALKELYAGVPAKEEDIVGVEFSDEWTYEADYCNDNVYRNYMLNAQHSEITCYQLTDSLTGAYRFKWEKQFDHPYTKVELLGIVGGTVYYSLVSISLDDKQELLALDLASGKEIFTRQLNRQPKTDSVKAMGISNLYCDGKTIYIAGTYMVDDPENPYPFVAMTNGQSRARGYDNVDLFIMYAADGYFAMSLDAKTGQFGDVMFQQFPSVDKTVDRRDYRVSVCPGIAPLKNGNMVVFFEHYSCGTQITANSFNPSGSRFGDEANPAAIKWELDAFTSVVFEAKTSTFTHHTKIWEDDVVSYTLEDFDMFALNISTEYPIEYVTVGDDGAYPQQFICDGTNWAFVIRCDDDLSPDYVYRGDENEQKIVKLINSGIVYMYDPMTIIDQKTTDVSITLKVVKH